MKKSSTQHNVYMCENCMTPLCGEIVGPLGNKYEVQTVHTFPSRVACTALQHPVPTGLGRKKRAFHVVSIRFESLTFRFFYSFRSMSFRLVPIRSDIFASFRFVLIFASFRVAPIRVASYPLLSIRFASLRLFAIRLFRFVPFRLRFGSIRLDI